MNKEEICFYIDELVNTYEEMMISDESIQPFLRRMAKNYAEEAKKEVNQE